MLKKFITRPVLATVISLILLILGVVGMTSLPITTFPEIAPPAVVVTTLYPGASGEVIARSVAPPLEDAINGVEGMTYMTSTSSNDGSLTITVYFKLGVNPDQAAVNVQNRVSQATSQLPAEVVQYGITTVKQQNSAVMFLTIFGKDSTVDETFLQNYAKINVVPELKRVAGVGQATVFGNKDYSMRIWMKPEQMSAYHVTPAEISAAIQDQNLEAAPGRFGQKTDEAMEYVIKYKGKLTNPQDYEDIIVRANADGSVLRLKDLARVEFGSFTYGIDAKFNTTPACVIAVYQTAGSNANELVTQLRERLATLSKSFPPGVTYAIPYSSKESLDGSIEQVIHTLIEAFILVFIVVYIFLQDFRSTLIPAIAVPVSIVGTFFFMQLFGFSINLLTLFALVLAIGIVVDDAIVVVEAVHAKMEHKGLPAEAAATSAMSEITGAIISITLVMSAVFLPVGFMDGPTGVFYRQFALTLAICIIISAINALTLSPALCALFLRNEHGGHKNKFFTGFNAGFQNLTNRYGQSVFFLIKKKWIGFAGLAAIIVALLLFAKSTPTGFIPEEDQGFLISTVTLPPGSSQQRTTAAMEEGRKLLASQPFVQSIIFISGVNLLTNSMSSSAGAYLIQLKPLEERGEVKDINQILGTLQGMLSSRKDASFFVLSIPTVPGFGTTSGIELALQDRTASSIDNFNKVGQGFVGELMKQPEIAFAFTTFNTGYPQYEMVVDEKKAKQLGVSVRSLMSVMQGFYGGMQASDFNRFGKYYRVMIQSDPEDRRDLASLDGITVTNAAGQTVPVNTILQMKRIYGTEFVEHFNLFNSINFTVMAKPGFSTGQAIQAIERAKQTNLPNGFTTEWKGLTREEQSAGGKTLFIFALCVVFVYLLLSAQYESYLLPFAVMLSIPAGLVGVFLGIKMGGIANNIYVQVALIMLIGLLAKNAILIVEYALQRRKTGKTLVAAAMEGAKARLRPIIMTSFAFIAGLLPLLRAKGPSALGNHSIGWAAVFGMLSGVILGIFIIPMLFVVFQYIQESIRRKKPQIKPQAAILILIVMTLMTSCSGPKYATPQTGTPATFRTASDSLPPNDTDSGIAAIPYRNFFSDTILIDLIDSGIANSYNLQIALRQIDLAQTAFKQAQWGNVPTVGLTAGQASITRSSDNSLNGLMASQFLGKSYVLDYTSFVGISWQTGIWGKIKNTKEAALAGYLQTKEAARAVQTRLVSDIAQGYYNLLMLDEQKRITEKTIGIYDNSILMTKLMRDAGNTTSLAVEQQEAAKQQAEALLPQLIQQTKAQENAISYLIGKPPHTINRSTLASIAIYPYLNAGLPANMISGRPDIRQAELAVRKAHAQMNVARASMYPNLNISAQAGLDAFTFSNWFKVPGSLFALASGSITQPLLQGRQLKTAYEQSKITRDQTELQFKQSVLGALGEVSNALINIEETKRQQDHIVRQGAFLGDAVKHSGMLFQSGQASYLDVLTAQNAKFQADLSLAGVQRQLLSSEVVLYQALGGGWK